MKDQYTFQRYEIKYLVTDEIKSKLIEMLTELVTEDPHGKSTISSLYLDTPDHLLIRNSIDGKAYKEKLRLRSYGIASENDKVFLEIKKKYKSVVYKRRESMKLNEAMEYIQTGRAFVSGQIMREIDYAFSYYNFPKPFIQISYDREAFYWKDNTDIRLTFDRSIRYRTNEISLSTDNFGKTILPKGQNVLEIKTAGAIPLVLAHTLDRLGIFPRSFSKYKRSYFDFLENT